MPPEAIPALLARLADDQPEVRAAAAQALGGGPGGTMPPEAIPALLARLADDQPKVRFAAAQALGGGPGGTVPPEAIPALLARLADDQPKVRAAVANTLMYIETTRIDAISVLLALLADDDPGIRAEAFSRLRSLFQLPNNPVSVAVQHLPQLANCLVDARTIKSRYEYIGNTTVRNTAWHLLEQYSKTTGKRLYWSEASALSVSPPVHTR